MIDVEWLYYLYTTVLGKSEEEFWKSTPAKIYSQLDCHKEAHSKEKTRNVKKSKNGSYQTSNTRVLKGLD